MKKFVSIIYWLIVSVLIFIGIIFFISILDIPNGPKFYNVLTGSMFPTIPVGSVVIVTPQKDYKKGEIITYKFEKDRLVSNPKETTTHRIYSINKTGNNIEYITKGDSNGAPDPVHVKKDLVLGKLIFFIPLLGYPIGFTKTLPGLIILVIIPGTILIYSELIIIKNELIKVLVKKKNEKNTN